MKGRFDRIVRCSQDHLYTSIVIPGASLKSLRLGNKRYQHCPVGKHWALTEFVDPSTLTPGEIEEAESVHDIRIP